MKKLLLAGLLLTTTTVNAGLFDAVATSGWKTKPTTSKYKVDAYGFDVRVHEWTPEDNKDYTCILVTGNSNSSGVACYPKKKKEK